MLYQVFYEYTKDGKAVYKGSDIVKGEDLKIKSFIPPDMHLRVMFIRLYQND